MSNNIPAVFQKLAAICSTATYFLGRKAVSILPMLLSSTTPPTNEGYNVAADMSRCIYTIGGKPGQFLSTLHKSTSGLNQYVRLRLINEGKSCFHLRAVSSFIILYVRPQKGVSGSSFLKLRTWKSTHSGKRTVKLIR